MKYKTPCLALCSSLLLSALPGVAQDKPNILVIWSDDVGQFLKILDELGIAEKTIVHYSTDNGPHYNTWPDAAATPFRGEKNTNWQGGWRVPCVVRWPGVV